MKGPYNRADTGVWRLAHSVGLNRRPEILAVRSGLADFGAEGPADIDDTKAGWLAK
ncbi:hypothetical protein [Streptomyces sp. NPDC001135]